MEDCVFCKIVRGELPAEKVFEDETVLAFKDIKPVKPVHYLFIPKVHVKDFTEGGEEILAIKRAIAQVVQKLKLLKKGYRVEVNGGVAMGVPHLHFHLLAPMGPAEKV